MTYRTAAAAAAVLGLAGCGTTESSTSTPSKPATTSAPAIQRGVPAHSKVPISLAQAEHIWLSKFVALVEAESEKTLHLNSPGVEQRCKSEAGAYKCKGVVPVEQHYTPGHEMECIVPEMVIDAHTGQITSEMVDTIQQYREKFHVEMQCHL
jgi:hypothetical protein